MFGGFSKLVRVRNVYNIRKDTVLAWCYSYMMKCKHCWLKEKRLMSFLALTSLDHFFFWTMISGVSENHYLKTYRLVYFWNLKWKENPHLNLLFPHGQGNPVLERLQETAFFLSLKNVAKFHVYLWYHSMFLQKLISNQKDRIMITFSRGTDKVTEGHCGQKHR